MAPLLLASAPLFKGGGKRKAQKRGEGFFPLLSKSFCFFYRMEFSYPRMMSAISVTASGVCVPVRAAHFWK